MHLTLGGLIKGKLYNQHEAIIIRDTTTTSSDDNVQKVISLIPSVSEWQKPEWSTNYNYAVATGNNNNLWYVYMINLINDEIKKIVADSNTVFDVYPHLWVPTLY